MVGATTLQQHEFVMDVSLQINQSTRTVSPATQPLSNAPKHAVHTNTISPRWLCQINTNKLSTLWLCDGMKMSIHCVLIHIMHHTQYYHSNVDVSQLTSIYFGHVSNEHEQHAYEQPPITKTPTVSWMSHNNIISLLWMCPKSHQTIMDVSQIRLFEYSMHINMECGHVPGCSVHYTVLNLSFAIRPHSNWPNINSGQCVTHLS